MSTANSSLDTRAGRRLPWFLRVLLTFHLVALAWIFFRASSLQNAGEYLRGMLAFRATSGSGGTPASFESYDVVTAVAGMLVVLLLIDLPQYRRGDHKALLQWPFLLKVAALGLFGACVLLARGVDHVAFIYFQF
jgi:hypothetical protein